MFPAPGHLIMTAGHKLLEQTAKKVRAFYAEEVSFRGKVIKICIRQTPEAWPQESSMFELADAITYIPTSFIGSAPTRDEVVTRVSTGERFRVVSSNRGATEYIVLLKNYKGNP